jgi:hypothetical protein
MAIYMGKELGGLRFMIQKSSELRGSGHKAALPTSREGD